MSITFCSYFSFPLLVLTVFSLTFMWKIVAWITWSIFFLRKVAYDSILCGFYLQLNCIIISWSFAPAPTILLISLMKNIILSYCHEAYQSKFLDQMRTPASLMSSEIALPLMSLKVLDYEQTDWHELSHSYCLSQSMIFHGLTFNLYIVVVSYVNHCRCESNASFKMDM
jgi:hypothetical protein